MPAKTIYRRCLVMCFLGAMVAFVLSALPMSVLACNEHIDEIDTALATCKSSTPDIFAAHYITYETELEACRRVVVATNDALARKCDVSTLKRILLIKATALAQAAYFWSDAQHEHYWYRPALSEARQAASLLAYANTLGSAELPAANSLTNLLSSWGVSVSTIPAAASPLAVGTNDQIRSDTIRSCIESAIAINVFPDWGKLSCPQAAKIARSDEFDGLVRLWGTNPTPVELLTFKAVALLAGGLVEHSGSKSKDGARYMNQGLTLAKTLPTDLSQRQLSNALQALVVKAQADL